MLTAPGSQARPGTDRPDPGPAGIHRAPRPEPARLEPARAHDRPTGTVIRRYERDRPGELVHVDIRKLGNIPDDGDHRVLTRQSGETNRQAATPARSPSGTPKIGYSFIHTAVDDHSRLAHSEIHTDEGKNIAVAFWHRAHAFFASHGITVERVLTDNGSPYKFHAWRDALAAAGIAHKRTRPYRPQTNGKAERFNRTRLAEWAYLRPYTTDTERADAFPPFLHAYNHHRCHSALGGQPRSPVSTTLRANTPSR